MFAATLAAIAAFKVVFFGKNNVSFGTVIEIFRLQFFLKHCGTKIGIRDLFHTFNRATDRFCFLFFRVTIGHQSRKSVF